MKTICVKVSKTYDILIGDGILENAGAILKDTVGGQAAAIITDDNVAKLYGERLLSILAQNGYRTASFIFPNGESSKSGGTFLSLLDFLAAEKLGRADVVVALGGGVTGDLAGFAAACYMRGIRFAQIPTTLLAAVDSSVGGKTAVNLDAGKNLAGAFYQPDVVLCDIALLSTLTPQTFRDGVAEVIKYGVIADKDLFEALKIPIRDQLEDIIARCVTIKRDIVSGDEFEYGNRKLLNFGHTVGHAIELLSEYSVSHGHAVAAGMAIAGRAAARMGLCGEDSSRSITQMILSYDLPDNTRYDAQMLAEACLSDKKREGESITMIFPKEIGKCVLKKIPVGQMKAVIASGLEEL
ncbi:MAG: 3-dehydroquinate synthase [Oscillospiraceae bacterium]|nr:3-dehydroquinate synthase [Oscillospiraceae bacterium]